MSHDIINRGHYSIYIDNPSNALPVVNLGDLADALPHGSGIDGDWSIEVFANGNVKVSSEYHKMTEGFYNGWVPFSFRLMKSLTTARIKLKGPCEGQTQIMHVPGDVVGRMYLREGVTDFLDEWIVMTLHDAGIRVAWWY